jgi:hypothetical protein
LIVKRAFTQLDDNCTNISPTLLKEFPMLVPPLSLPEKFAQNKISSQQRGTKK